MSSDVRADEAAALGAQGVPFSASSTGGWGVSGAQPANVLWRALRQAQNQ